MRRTHSLLILLFTACGVANAQVVPAATGIVRAGKNLQYAARYDETAVFSSDQTNWQTATTSGSLNYMNTNERHPFTAQYTGGYTWTSPGRTTNPDSFTNFF